MSVKEVSFSCSCCVLLLLSFVFIEGHGQPISGETETDKEVLLALKGYLEENNRVRRGEYARWNESDSTPCNWSCVTCNDDQRVTGINLADSNIGGELFSKFSLLTELTHLDLSSNTIRGPIPADINKCSKLKYLNLSSNIIDGELNLTGLTNLVTLDLTVNRLNGSIRSSFPAICAKLVTLNISTNSFSGDIIGCFEECTELKYLDLSSNHLTGQIWRGFTSLRVLVVSENYLVGDFSSNTFASDCELEILDLSRNHFSRVFPDSIANCSKMTNLNLWGNKFTGAVPSGIGSLSELKVLYLGNNSFDRNIPNELLNCSKLILLDFSKNNFTGEVQKIFGQFRTLNYLIIHGNNYTGGIESSGILELPKLIRLDLSQNKFSGDIPVGITKMQTLKILIMADNEFSGGIPPEFGGMPKLQCLDLSHNKLNGSIPPTIGNLTSLLWLMLADNELTGEIPIETGNCSSLLWLNLANNRLTGSIPPEIAAIGSDPWPTFEANRREMRELAPGSGDCLAMKRWIPVSYPPFNFTYALLTRKTCPIVWDLILKGYGFIPVCNGSSRNRSFGITGYLQLSGNQLSGGIPPEIGRMRNISLMHLDVNKLSGRLPFEITKLPLTVLNVSCNKLSGEIPAEIGGLQCLASLDLSVNNFSGELPGSLNNLCELNKFNVSYNPLLSGVVPKTGQISTFDKYTYLGTLIKMNSSTATREPPPTRNDRTAGRNWRAIAFWVFVALTSVFVASGAYSLVIVRLRRTGSAAVDPDPDSDSDQDPEGLLLDGVKSRSDAAESSTPSACLSSSVEKGVRVFRLDDGTTGSAFTYDDILAATENFDERKVVGQGGCGVVYEGVLHDGRRVAVKKMRRWKERGKWEDEDAGEREFRVEMEVMTGARDRGHPNLVPLYGWCLARETVVLVYQYMERGSLEDVIDDWERFGWEQRLAAATGVARALAFLHHECMPAVVHRDVKASNVMLDAQGQARVTDFGLARAVGPGRSHVSTTVAGTVGYVAPEYGQTWRATTRGDVYSYGVLAMELATGRRAVDGGEECLVERMRREAAEEGGLRAVGKEGMMDMIGLIRVGLSCTAEAPAARPDMRKVVAMLVKIAGGESESGRSSSSGSLDTSHNSSPRSYWEGYF
ncbi:putative LRR receptor-like serine/threonine-protein kinase [Canna indica]|uniref:non-specific serine/threonine protein kinase n=1 Tax=Canna indica TaxID=4628 RepID=A0AAQ3K7S5_9LILI|nr:putative LRR receptor-like serine/threonine-protein kinase [Canna indica]